ncbi:ATP-binding protein [Erythrobacter sp. MTPC3]|uniref:ATP-binding protein n=1 Tax=Erythrobacter sp. MTPC3 TaxID=3056564 RepID=UPI0036F1D966
MLFALLGASTLFAQTAPARSVSAEPAITLETATYYSDPETELNARAALALFKAGAFDPLASDPRTKGDSMTRWTAAVITVPQASGDLSEQRLVLRGQLTVLPKAWIVDASGELRPILGEDGGTAGAERYLHMSSSSSFDLPAGSQTLILINTASSLYPTISVLDQSQIVRTQMREAAFQAATYSVIILAGFGMAIMAIIRRSPIILFMTAYYAFALTQPIVPALGFTSGASAEDVGMTYVIYTSVTALAGYILTFFAFRKYGYPKAALAFCGAGFALYAFAWTRTEPSELRSLVFVVYYLPLAPSLLVMWRELVNSRAAKILFFGAHIPVLIAGFSRNFLFPDMPADQWVTMLAIERVAISLTYLAFGLLEFKSFLRDQARESKERIAALEAQAETDRRLLAAEREYDRAREAAARRKAQLAAASHDIRQPILGLRVALDSEAERLSPALRSRLGDAIGYLENLTREYSASDDQIAGSADAAIEAYPLEVITRAVHDMFAGEAAEAGVAFIIEGGDCTTTVPPLALIRAISNLVANALRHSEATEIQLQVRGDDQCEFTVIDNGKGMDQAALADAQRSGVKSENSTGDGLGLAIVHDLAQRYRFHFSMASTAGEGTTARLRFAGKGSG